MLFEATADVAYRFVRGLGVIEVLLRDLDEARRAQAVAALRATIEAHETADGVLYRSAAWIIQARRARALPPRPARHPVRSPTG